MPKKPVSVTLEAGNLLWLRGRVVGQKARSLSDALDEVVSRARAGDLGREPARSVVGTVDLPADDPALEQADQAIRAVFGESLSRPVLVRERGEPFPAPTRPARRRQRPRHG